MSENYLSSKKLRHVDKWLCEVQEHLKSGTFVNKTESSIPKEYAVDKELPGQRTKTCKCGPERASVPKRPQQLTTQVPASDLKKPVTGFGIRPQSSKSGVSSKTRPGALTRSSTAGLRDKKKIATPTHNDDNTNKSTHCQRCNETINGEKIARKSTPDSTATVNSTRHFAPPVNSEFNPLKSCERGAYRIQFHNIPKLSRTDIDFHGHSTGYPPWVTGARAVISCPHSRRATSVMYSSGSGVLLKRMTPGLKTRV